MRAGARSDRVEPTRGVTRRGLIAGAAATGAAAAMWPARADAATATPSSADVVVVGAGFAGLTAARADRRGRHARWSCSRRATASAAASGTTTSAAATSSERGGTFVGPTQDHVMALAQGARRRHVPDLRHRRQRLLRRTADRIDVQRHRADRHRAARPARSCPTSRRRRAARPDVAEVPVDAPWTAPNAADWDSQTLETWIDSQHASRRGSAQVVADRHPADLRRRAARAVAAVHALLHRGVGQRDRTRARSSATSTRATARSSRASSAARR